MLEDKAVLSFPSTSNQSEHVSSAEISSCSKEVLLIWDCLTVALLCNINYLEMTDAA